MKVVGWHKKRIDRKYRKLGFEEQWFEPGHSKMRYFIGGKGPSLLLVHGFGANGPITWEKQVRHLVKNFQIIIPDLCWFGESSSTLPCNLNTQIRVIWELIDHLEIADFSVAGISYGGFITLGLGCTQPERVRKLCIVNSPGNTYDHSLLKELSAKAGVDQIEDLFVPTTPEEILRLVDLAFRKKRRIPMFVLKQMQEHYFSLHQEEQRQLLYTLKTMNPSVFDTMVLRDKEVHIVWGEDDAVFPLSEGKKLAKHLNCPITIIPKGGHAINVERTKKFNQILIDILSD